MSHQESAWNSARFLLQAAYRRVLDSTVLAQPAKAQ
jgi:hypothetical protein